MSVAAPIAPLAWTGERMVPNVSDPFAEAQHWQRYAYFRPWYDGARFADAGCGEGYGTGYAALFAAQATGIDADPSVVRHAAKRYVRAEFDAADAATFDFASYSLAFAFGLLEGAEDPDALLRSLARCEGTIVLSLPHGRAESSIDRVVEAFPSRRLRFLNQEARWPGLIREGLDLASGTTLVVVDGGPLPSWPSLGLAMPCCGGTDAAAVALTQLSMRYPGTLEIALVAQGCDAPSLDRLRREAALMPHVVHLVERSRNLGAIQGMNVGLAFLKERGLDFVGVCHDDMIPAPDCLPQMVAAAQALQEAGHPVGMVGPVSNGIEGDQRAEIGPFPSLDAMHDRALAWGAERHSHVDDTRTLSGLLLLMSPECLAAVGGFDPRFGFGGFEDDDLCLRARLSGHPQWIAPGAFVHHAGASSFRSLGLDYEDATIRNLALFLEKWDCDTVGETYARATFPEGQGAFVAFDAAPSRSEHLITINGIPVDLVHQASEFDMADWIVTKLRDKPREARIAILDALAAV